MAGQSGENVQTFRKGFFLPWGHRWLPLKLWLLNLTKRTNLELWLFLTIPISSSGWWGNVLCKLGVTRRRNSGYFRNIKNIFFSVDLGQNLLNTTRFLQFLFHSRVLFCIISLHGEKQNDKRVKMHHSPIKRKQNCQGSSGCDHQVATL